MAAEATATTVAQEAPPKKKFKLKVPTAFTILFIITILAVIATHFIPAGQYAKVEYVADAGIFQITEPGGEVREVEGTEEAFYADEQLKDMKIDVNQFLNGAITKPISVPGTYTPLESAPMGPYDVFTSMVNGTINGVDIMVFILVLGGLIGVVNASGAFESGLVALTQKTKGREFFLVFLVSALMTLGGTTCGLEEEAVAFYPILAPVFIALGYDSIVTVGAIFLAGSMGTTFSTINPFAVVIASNAAGVQWTEGIEWRIAGCIVGGIVVIAYLYWYCKKIKKNPEASYTYEDREHFASLFNVHDSSSNEIKPFTWQRKLILVLFVLAFILMVYGVVNLGWWFPQMAASFLAIAIICMFLTGLDEKSITDAFVNGASSLVGVSLIIGLARGVNMIMEEGLISDTLLYWATNAVTGMQGPVFILMMMFIFFLLGFIVPSSSGLAVLSMPILAPLADTVGIDRSIVVSAYNWGQYAMLYLAPTGLVMATLTMLDMKYTHWLKFVLPMVGFLFVFGGALLVAQVMLCGA
ncbi:YfcC family protein [uncultured Slackia sp.]|uniref:YfcC family protein n=1 Tax=uncultured Slackia sp. TaxID=665903 RepID=UPI0025F9E223|nr:YfcC family protein [uncultured Slackia sp.]